MTINEFVRHVKWMREAQVRYFATRSSKDLTLARRLERSVDHEVKKMSSGNQVTLPLKD